MTAGPLVQPPDFFARQDRPMRITTPSDFLLARDACSYGYFVLEPNFWDPSSRALRRVLDLAGKAATVTITQGAKGAPLTLRVDRPLSPAEKTDVRRQVSRMLRLDEDASHLRAFHTLDPRWKRSGRGRVFRSPTFFEDVIKTVTSCNVTWPSTVGMNRRLCEHFGAKALSGLRAFPTARALSRVRPASLRARCGVGYRDGRIVELAKMFAKDSLNGVHPDRFEDPATTDTQLREWLLELHGIGPYAAANILQLLGRYGHLPLDTESVRHGKTVLGLRGSSAAIMKKVAAHFAPFGAHAFRSYWFEVWEYYEQKQGKSWTWEREKTASTFTAKKL